MPETTHKRYRPLLFLTLIVLLIVLTLKLAQLRQERVPLIEEADVGTHEVGALFEIQTG
ncbi:hypothetical protein VIN01S_18210 [Vibrio inusitatus NBRC 102082]|uniref:Uncharacterized protein n=1 Tax=Vibrio inusitatus NBRC 102082 TaxID=1219070 RepID=A0A4Y3HVD0_9VIBR|nr:hypothetical protein [Vibrio inusitatus]GEA51017.1 hypothetical protein VIN01S_18210 [Vibrio inusitatus NBRC 102082]